MIESITLICKPAGRGKWHETEITIKRPRYLPLLVRPGERFQLMGITWRIVRVLS